MNVNCLEKATPEQIADVLQAYHRWQEDYGLVPSSDEEILKKLVTTGFDFTNHQRPAALDFLGNVKKPWPELVCDVLLHDDESDSLGIIDDVDLAADAVILYMQEIAASPNIRAEMEVVWYFIRHFVKRLSTKTVRKFLKASRSHPFAPGILQDTMAKANPDVIAELLGF